MDKKYSRCIDTSKQISWKIKDLLPVDFKFDFTKKYLPNSLTLENNLKFLSDKEKLDLNHIRSVANINKFAFIEECIIALQVKFASEGLSPKYVEVIREKLSEFESRFAGVYDAP